MYWRVEALTAKRSELIQTMKGNLEDIENHAKIYGLEILSISPDYSAILKNIFLQTQLSYSVLTVFFKDFADMQRSGLSVNEAIHTLNETTSNKILQEALRKIANYIQDGRSLEESFEMSGVFPKMVAITLAAAEKTGNIPELLETLARYYSFKSENRHKMIKSLIYPTVIFCLLTGLSIFISIKLVPLMRSFLPPSARDGFTARMLIDYAAFIRNEGWMVILFLIALGFGLKHGWRQYQDQCMEVIFKVPLIGDLMKNAELSYLFLNLYVYQKSGVNIIQTITHIHDAHKSYVTDKLLLIRERLFKGTSIGDSFKQDPFFSSFVCQNLSKGQISGSLPMYLERIHRYYEIKSTESITAMIALVEPLLLVMAAAFLLVILCTFILPIYSNMTQLGDSVFK